MASAANLCTLLWSNAGKTTLLEHIRAKLGADVRCITEVARTVMKKHDISREVFGDSKGTSCFQRLIFDEQLQRENAERERGFKVVSDRSLLDPIAYELKHCQGNHEGLQALKEKARSQYSEPGKAVTRPNTTVLTGHL